MKIRKMTRQDIEGLVDLHRSESKKISRSTYRNEFQAILGKPYRETYVFIEDNKIKGYVTISKDFPGYKNCEITRLFVHKKYRRKNIGRKLLEYIERRLKKQGFLNLCVYTAETKNERARKFYVKCGYNPINRLPLYFKKKRENPRAAILYAKSLVKT